MRASDRVGSLVAFGARAAVLFVATTGFFSTPGFIAPLIFRFVAAGILLSALSRSGGLVVPLFVVPASGIVCHMFGFKVCCVGFA